MNKMLVAIFENEKAADAGLHALRNLHSDGEITLYAASVVAKDAKGHASIMHNQDQGPMGTVVGMAVGSLIGLMGGPPGVVVGAVTGSMAGAVRDYWVAGVGLDFIDAAGKSLSPGKVALVAEIEEEWVYPVDAAMGAAGGHVYRRTRSEFAEAQFAHDITAFKSEIKGLEAETSRAGGAAKEKLHDSLVMAKTQLDGAVQRAKQRVDTLKQEADSKAESLTAQLSHAAGEIKERLEERVKRVRASYQARGTKLSKAWSLTKEALAA